MNAKDLRPCPCCKGVLGSTPVMISAQRMYVDYKVVNEYAGLNQYLQGNTALTDIFAPDVELVKKVPDSKLREILVCMECFLTKLGELAVVIAEDFFKTDEKSNRKNST